MDDMKRRLEFHSVPVQIQAVEKLYNEVKKKKPKGQRLSSATPEFAELKALWQYTCSDQGLVARRCSQLWIQLMKDQSADFTYVLNGFLNLVPTTRNLYGIVDAISEMMALQVILKHTADEEYKCPYEIRSPPHPLVTVITNRLTESWPLILEQIDRFFSHPEECVQKNVFAMLDPFLKFVLLDPKCSEQYSRLRTNLKVRLVNLVGRVDNKDIQNHYLQYLVELIHKMQVDSAEDTVETGDFCVQLLYLYGNNSNNFDHCHGNNLAAYAVELCQIYQEKNLDFFSIISAILKMSKQAPKVLSTDENMATLGQVMLLASHDDCVMLLQIVKSVLKNGSGDLSPLCAGMVSMATINIIATPQMVAMTMQKQLSVLASEVMTLLEEFTMDSSSVGYSKMSANMLSSMGYTTRAYVQMARSFLQDVDSLKTWLASVHKHISRMETVSLCLTNLLVSVLLQLQDTETSLLVIDRLSDVVKCNPAQGLYLLPVYLFVIGKSSCPTLKLHTLNALPKLATHKFNVAPVMKTILNLAQSPKLKSLSIRLLTDLWALQDRCFPHLQKAITGEEIGHVTMATLSDDVTLARAMAIKEICRLRPEQHGAEMLGPLSDILNVSKDIQSAPAAAICLEALYYICEAEVIDIMSAWRVLEDQLVHDTRTVVMVKVCSLLSLVPGLKVKTAEYDVFLSESVRRLWLFTQSSNETVVSASYAALSKFSQDDFKISHLKYQIVKDFVDQAETVLAQSENEDDTIDTVMPFLPGVCYTRLLSELNDKALLGFQEFLSTMVAKEADNLPRGIHFTSLRQQGLSANQSREMSGIPSFLQSQYEKTKQPGLRPNLAVGMLFSYDPRVEVGRDGRPRKHYVISHGKNYQQMFNTLLQDVPVQPSDWYRTSLMGQAWTAFVDRLFAAMLQARKAEIELQLNREFIDEKEAEEKKASAWLWVRDSLVDVIKKYTRSNPSVQFNAVLALSGLAHSVQRYVASLEPEERKQTENVTEHMSHSHWLMMMIDSCMSLVDFTYKPKSSLFGLCQQRSVDDRLPSSVLAQAAAILALCQVASLIINNYIELIYHLLDLLVQWLPQQQKDEECPPVLYFFRSYGLGVLIEQLILSNFTEITGSKGSLAVWKAMDKLEACCMSQNEHRTGALLGLTVCLRSLCCDGKTESRVHVSAVHVRLQDVVKVTRKDDSNFQALCTCLGVVSAVGYGANILNKDSIDETIIIVQDMQDKGIQSMGTCVAIGSLCYAAEAAGHPTIGQLKKTLISDWSKHVTSAESTELERVASLYGLMAITGYSGFNVNEEAKLSSMSAVGIDSLITCLRDLVTSCDLVGIQATASWLLGNIYMSASSTNYSSSSAPGTYSYLQESSVLRAVADFVFLAGKQGPEFIRSSYVEVCLESLQREVTATLPPLNWMGILSPLMKMSFDEDVKLSCIQLAVKLSSSAPSAALFLSAWIVPPLFNTLSVKCQGLLLSSTGHYVKTITPGVLETFIDKSCKPVFSKSSASTGSLEGRLLKQAVLKGLYSALSVHDPPESVSAKLFETVQFLYEQTDRETDIDVLIHLSECLRHIPDTLLDKLTTGDCTDKHSVIRGTFIRCFLVGNGNQPIALLNSCIDAAFNVECKREDVLWYLMHCFHRMTVVDGKKSPLMQCVQWLHEITGHCRNIATGTFKLTAEDADIAKITEFTVSVIAVAICLWTSKSSAACLLGVNFDLFTHTLPGFKKNSDLIDTSSSKDKVKFDWLTGIRPLECLPTCIQKLTSEPWVQIMQKIIDWTTAMLGTADDITSNDVKKKLTESLHCLRHTTEYKKLAVWTKTVMLIA